MATATEKKHSLGPWRIFRSGDEIDIRSAKFAREPFPTSIHVATMSDCNERDANARLIAAAPAMLQELEDVLDFAIYEKLALLGEPEIRSLRAIIRLAKGEE